MLEEIGRYLLKQVLKLWEERIIAAFCEGGTTVRHHRKGRRGRDCEGRGAWIRKGKTGRERSFTTLLGEVKLRLREVKCRGCGARLRPPLGWLGLAHCQREERDKTERHRPGSGPFLPARSQANVESRQS